MLVASIFRIAPSRRSQLGADNQPISIPKCGRRTAYLVYLRLIAISLAVCWAGQAAHFCTIIRGGDRKVEGGNGVFCISPYPLLPCLHRSGREPHVHGVLAQPCRRRAPLPESSIRGKALPVKEAGRATNQSSCSGVRLPESGLESVRVYHYPLN